MDTRYSKTQAPTDFDEFEQAGYRKDSRWHNPTDKPVKVLVHHNTPTANGRPPRDAFERTGKKPFIVEPGETKTLGSEFDAAIHQLDREGMIVGGLAPQLRKVGEEDRPMHPALDNERSLRLKAEAEAAAALNRMETEKQALIMAQAEVARLRAETERLQALHASQESKASAAPAAKQPQKG